MGKDHAALPKQTIARVHTHTRTHAHTRTRTHTLTHTRMYTRTHTTESSGKANLACLIFSTHVLRDSLVSARRK